ncbi:MAG: prepilin-type N-terminal cleavage/methylation domain-containing protein [Myxococcota bacterium]
MILPRRRSVAGYTVIEVMMALAVLSVGATGIIAMQKAALIGNTRARDLATANAIAAAWVDRLRLDAQRWQILDNGTNSILQTVYLREVGDDYPSITGNENLWIIPPAVGLYNPAADVHGADTATLAEQGFCTHIRLLQVLPNLIRADVRVFWLRNGGLGTINGQPLCADDAGYVAGVSQPEADRRYHFVQVTSGILRTDD